MTKQILDMYANTTLSKEEIADKLGVTFATVQHRIQRHMSKKDRKKYKTVRYSSSKLGHNNPMKGKFKEDHHNYVGLCEDGKGYLLVLKPEWFTGKKKSKHIFQHHAVLLKHLRMTELPLGYCVHHMDGDKKNNDVSNLQLMTIGDHRRLHASVHL
jgi:hypothetical protein